MTPSARPLRIVLSAVFALICLSCGGGDSGSTSQPSAGAGSNSNVATGTVRIQSVLARTVPSSVTHFRATGFDLNGAAVFGPETVPKAANVEFVVPVTVSRLQIEYLAGTNVVGIGSTNLTVQVGQVTDLANLDFQTVSAALNSLSITPGVPSLAKGTSLQFSANGSFADGSQLDLTSSVSWSTVDSSVAAVTSTGNLTAVAPGTTIVRATLGSVSTQVTATVSAATVSSVSISPQPVVLAQGTNGQLRATATFSDGTQQNVTNSATWTSQDPTKVTVDAMGQARAGASGTTTVQAGFGGHTGQVTVLVSGASLTQIVVTPAGSTLAAGTSQNMTATGVFSDNSTQNLSSSVTWSSQDSAVATVSASGQVGAVAPGVTTMVASLNGLTGQTGLTVSSATVTSVVVTPPVPTVSLGVPQQFTATANFSDGSQQDVTATATWSSSDPGVASVNTSGLATPRGTGQSSVSAQFQGRSGSATMTVDSATVTSLSLTPSTLTLANGTSRQLTLLANFSDGSQRNVTSSATWASGTPATVGVSPGGLASALGAGGSTIEARFGGQTASTQITVSPAVIQSLTVTPRTPAIALGTNQQFTAMAHLSDGSAQDVTSSASWVSGTPLVATINGSGLVSSASSGQTAITASLSGHSGTAILTVTAATVTSLALSPSNPAVVAGFTQSITATATFSDGSTQNVTSSAAWTSQTTAVATVTSPGRILAANPGNSVVRASFGGQTASTNFTVSSAIVTNIVITPPTPAVAQGATLQMTATAHFSDGTTQDVTSSGAHWFSNNPAIFTVSNTGLVRGVAQGQTKVNASFQLRGETAVTVTVPAVTGLTLTPTNPAIVEGQTQQFSVQASFSDGSMQDVTSSTTFLSDAPLVASVSNLGLATGLSPGGSRISATFGGTTTATNLTVGNPVVSRIDVTPGAPVVAQGTTRQLTARATMSNGSTQDVTNLATWSSTAPTVAAVNTTGLVTPAGAGQSFIEAAFGGRRGSSRVTVTVPDPNITGLTIEPSAALSAQDTTRQYRAVASLSDGSTRDVTSQVTWSSNNAQVVISNHTFGLQRVGQARIDSGASDGSNATITATLGALNATSTLTIHHFLFVSNQFTGTLSSYAINADGTLTAAQLNMTVPARATNLVVDPSGRYLYITHEDTNQLSAHRIQADGSLATNGTLATGRSPSRPVISPNGRFLFIANRQDQTLGAFRIAADGRLSPNGTLAHPSLVFPSSLIMDPQGRMVYSGGNNLVVAAIGSDGTLSFRESIAGFVVSPATDASGQNLYLGINAGGGSVSAYSVAADGTLTANGVVSTANVGADSLVVEGRNRFVYVSHSDTSDITGYQIGFDGALTALGVVANNPPGFRSAGPMRAESTGSTFYHAEPSGLVLPFRIEPSGQITPLATTNTGTQISGIALSP